MRCAPLVSPVSSRSSRRFANTVFGSAGTLRSLGVGLSLGLGLGLAAQKLPDAFLAGEDTVANLHIAANGYDRWPPLDLESVEGAVVVVGVMCLGRQSAAIVGIVDDQVGIAADGDRPLTRIEAEELRGTRAERVDESVHIEAAALYAVGIHQVDPLFEPGHAVGDVGEGIFAHHFLLEIEGAVVGAHGVNLSAPERVPERGLVAL